VPAAYRPAPSGCEAALVVTSSLVLVHSPLVGRDSWEAVAAILSRHGERVALADLTNAVVSGPPYWPREVEAIAAATTGPAILVGHSRAGPLLPVAARATRRVQGCVFVDARLPQPGPS
jgi:predicted alpha/beta hydrolase family esterase